MFDALGESPEEYKGFGRFGCGECLPREIRLNQSLQNHSE